MKEFLIFVPLVVMCVCYFNHYSSYSRKKSLRSPYRRKEPHSRCLRQVGYVDDGIFFRNLPKIRTFDGTVFPPLIEEEWGTRKASVMKYPWIARVVHSPDKDQAHSHLCTAACIEDRIFITAARCIYKAKVFLTTVVTQGNSLQAIAFVVPSRPSKAMFDDIGFIIVKNVNRRWRTIEVFSKDDNASFTRRGDDFVWFAQMTPTSEVDVTAVGYIMRDGNPILHETEAYASPFICQHYYNPDIGFQGMNYTSSHYFVPCYHPCSCTFFYSENFKCKKRLAGEGHVIVEKTTSKLIGIATWGGYFDLFFERDYMLPVGMALPNSKNFQEDLNCARTIRAAPDTSKTFDNLC